MNPFAVFFIVFSIFRLLFKFLFWSFRFATNSTVTLVRTVRALRQGTATAAQ